MSRLIVVARPELVTGFQLAGVDAFAAEDAASAQRLVVGWLDAGESGLLAVDEWLLDGFEPAVVARMTASERLPYLPLPDGLPVQGVPAAHSRIAQLLRQAVGFHISFQSDAS